MNQNLKFLNEVLAATAEMEKVMLNVWRGSVTDLCLTMVTPITQGGLLPFKTGNLMRSFWLSTSEFAVIAANQQKFEGMQDFVSVAERLEIGDIAYLSLRAAYAHRRNYGFVGTDSLGRNYNDEGTGFIERTALLWPTIVANNIRKYRSV